MSSQCEDVTVKESTFNYSLINYLKLYVTDSEKGVGKSGSIIKNEETSSTSSESPYLESSEMFESLKISAGAWGIHRFEKYPWSDYCRPCVKLEEYNDSSLNQDEESGLLTNSVISSSLSYLERAPYDLKYVLCKCILSHKKLTDINALTYYHYIQYLDLSWNNITTLAPLGQLPFLQYLNASHNNIEVLLDFKAPFYLGFVNFSHNSIETIPNLTEFWSIHHLDVSNNNITNISGLENLRYLQVLNLSHNKITTLENLENLRIQFLILHHNVIDNTNGNTMNLKALNYLRSVDISNNNLNSLKIFEDAENLENIDMSMNNISILLELYYLQNLRYLSKLNLSDNPVTEVNFYINVCLRLIKNLMVLDGKEISAETRIETKSNYEIDPKLKEGESHMDLILLQQINHPYIGPHIIPYDQPPPMILILVGPPGSRKKSMVQNICKKIKKCVAVVSHTTRPKTDVEIDGEDYYFISSEEFKDLARKGLFITVSEFNGYSYGITHEEIKKCQEGILVCDSDLNSALSLRLMGLNPKLVLAMPREEANHKSFLRNKYFYNNIEQGICRIGNSPSYIRSVESKSSMNSAKVVSRSIIEDIMQKAVDLKDYEELLRDENAEDENVKVHSTDKDVSARGRKLCSILKRSPGSDEDHKVTFFETPHTYYAPVSENVASIQSLNHSYSDINLSPPETDQFINIDTDHKSVSDNIIHLEEHNKNGFVHIFSALSSDEISSKSTEETVYMRPSEILELIRDENFSEFIKNIIDSRAALLDLHWSNPGLFREVIFTDEEESSLEKIKALIKFCLESYKSMKLKLPLKDNPTHQHIIKSKIKNLDLQPSAQYDTSWDEDICDL